MLSPAEYLAAVAWLADRMERSTAEVGSWPLRRIKLLILHLYPGGIDAFIKSL